MLGLLSERSGEVNLVAAYKQEKLENRGVLWLQADSGVQQLQGQSKIYDQCQLLRRKSCQPLSQNTENNSIQTCYFARKLSAAETAALEDTPDLSRHDLPNSEFVIPNDKFVSPETYSKIILLDQPSLEPFKRLKATSLTAKKSLLQTACRLQISERHSLSPPSKKYYRVVFEPADKLRDYYTDMIN